MKKVFVSALAITAFFVLASMASALPPNPNQEVEEKNTSAAMIAPASTVSLTHQYTINYAPGCNLFGYGGTFISVLNRSASSSGNYVEVRFYTWAGSLIDSTNRLWLGPKQQWTFASNDEAGFYNDLFFPEYIDAHPLGGFCLNGGSFGMYAEVWSQLPQIQIAAFGMSPDGQITSLPAVQKKTVPTKGGH